MRTIYRKLQLSRCGNASPLSTSDPGALPVIQPNDLLGVGRLGDLLISLGEHELHVAGVGHIWVDSTVGAVCPPPLLWGLVDLDVGNSKVGSVEALELSVGPGVLEEVQKESGGLDGPASTGDTELLSLCASPSTTGISPHWDGLLVPLNIFQVGKGTLKLHSANGLGNLTGVLEGHTEEGTTSLSSVGRAGRGGRVADHRVWLFV